MLKVLITDTMRTYDPQWFDLTNENGRASAIQFTDAIFSDQGKEYEIIDVISEWAQCDCYTEIQDMIEAMVYLETLSSFEYEIFLSIKQKHIHAPSDIVEQILDADILTEVFDEDNVWEHVKIEGTNYYVTH